MVQGHATHAYFASSLNEIFGKPQALKNKEMIVI
jgi:hypothetical protein